MTRLFVSFYLFVAISLFIISSALELILPNERDSETKETEVIQSILSLAASNKALLIDRLTKINADFEIKPIGAVGWSPEEYNSLISENVITLYDEEAKYIYAPIGNDELVSLTLPYERISIPYQIIYLLIFLVLLGLAMAVWLWPLWRDLTYITNKVSDLGHETDSISIVLKKRSIMQPIANRINLLSERVHKLLRDQRELTGAVAHEFRTPIARLKFALEMNPKPNGEAWKGVHADIDELEGLVQEMLDYTQYDAITPELSISEIPIKQLCQNVVRHLTPTTAKSLDVTGENVMVRGDGHFIERAVSNLLTNAIRHADAKILLAIHCSDTSVSISVADDGEGIEQALAERIFEPFFRPDNSRVRYLGGAGLGLAIVQRIQYWHKGSVKVEKSNLGGACFVLTYPR